MSERYIRFENVKMSYGNGDAQITIGLEDDQEYKVSVNGQSAGFVNTNLGGKLNISVELTESAAVLVEVKKC